MDDRPLINRLLSGIVIFKLKGEYIKVKPAKVEDKAFADFYAQEVYEDSLLDGVLTSEDLEKLLVEKGWWSKEEEEDLEQLRKNQEQMKVDYYNNIFNRNTKEYVGKSIKKLNKKIDKLFSKKHTFFDKSCEYLRDFSKSAILVEKYAFLQDGSLATNKFGLMPIISRFMSDHLPEKKLRKVANDYQWRSLWSSKDLGLFQLNACELTHEQISVVSWSRFYDGVYESMDRPCEEVIEDDIALDGWAIVQSRKRKEDEKKERGEKLVSDKMANAGEVFVPVSNHQEQEDVLALNDAYGKSVMQSKAKQFTEKGGCKDNQLIHVKKELQMEQLRQAKENRRR